MVISVRSQAQQQFPTFYLFVLISICMMLLAAEKADAMNPIAVAYACRMQCDRHFQMCVRTACE